MVHARRLALLLGTLALVGTAVSTGGFSVVSADRQVDVSTAPDSQAFLGVETHDQTLRAGTNEDTPLVTLGNQFGVPLTDVEVTVAGSAPPPTVVDTSAKPVDVPSSLGVGESGTVTASVVCGGSQSGVLTVDIYAAGRGVSVTMERTVRVDCLPPAEGEETAA